MFSVDVMKASHKSGNLVATLIGRAIGFDLHTTISGLRVHRVFTRTDEALKITSMGSNKSSGNLVFEKQLSQT